VIERLTETLKSHCANRNRFAVYFKLKQATDMRRATHVGEESMFYTSASGKADASIATNGKFYAVALTIWPVVCPWPLMTGLGACA
jgi:hypothetical protein